MLSVCGSYCQVCRSVLRMADDGETKGVGRHAARYTPVLPKITSEHPLRHDADVWLKTAKNTLGPLLAVAEGQTRALLRASSTLRLTI